MTRRRTAFEPGRLWDLLQTCTQQAVASGDLQSIETQQTRIEQEGIRFLVRVASNLRRKSEDAPVRQGGRQKTTKDFNPFLPPEKELTVTGVSDSHIAVLNKFNVVDHHLLVVTRRFEHQETLLGLKDFEALWLCLREYPSLGFYNGGTRAGASQRHKHLQLVPLPLVEEGPTVPVEPVLPTCGVQALGRIPAFPFSHVFTRLPAGLTGHPSEAARLSVALYRKLLEAARIPRLQQGTEARQGAPYNLLLTTEWMLLIPRSRERADDISINALAYAGSLFVRDNRDLQRVISLGPMHFLTAVGRPAPCLVIPAPNQYPPFQ